jgi:RES domain
MSDSAVPWPPDATTLDFPRFLLGTDVRLYRVHGVDREPRFYSADPYGRWNPPPGVESFGTLYCAASVEGAIIETLGRLGAAVILTTDLQARSISVLQPGHPLDLADMTDLRVLGQYGLTGAVSAAGPEVFERTHAWAAALRNAGLDGVRFRARHDPSLSQVSYALRSPRRHRPEATADHVHPGAAPGRLRDRGTRAVWTARRAPRSDHLIRIVSETSAR